MTQGSAERLESIRHAITDLVAVRGPGKTICPTEAAKAVDAENWRDLLKDVRAQAVVLAKSGEITIYRKGRAVDPDDFKGVYRLGVPGKKLPGSDGTR